MASKQKIAYLAGSMEYSDDNGLGWRLEARDLLTPLGIKCILPNEEEAQWIDDVDEFRELKKKDIHEYVRIHREFMKQDLDFTSTCDYFVCKWEGERIHGTTGEAQWRWQNGKDAYLVTSVPVEEIPGWFLASFTHLFPTLKDLKKWLEKQQDESTRAVG